MSLWERETVLKNLGARCVVKNSDLEGIEGEYDTPEVACAAARTIAWHDTGAQYEVWQGGELILLHPHQPTREKPLESHRGGERIWAGGADANRKILSSTRYPA